MKTMWLPLGLLLASLIAPVVADEPGEKKETWIRVETRRIPTPEDEKKGIQYLQNSWMIRVDGGPAKQVAWPPIDGSWRPPEDMRRKRLPGLGDRDSFASAWLSPDGKRALYHEEDPDFKGDDDKIHDPRLRIIAADADGKNAKPVLTGLSWFTLYIHECPDGKALVCGAKEKGKWYPFRVAFDGTVTRLSEKPGIAPPVVLPLLNDRYLYFRLIDKETVGNAVFRSVVHRGPVVLLDGKKETVLLKEASSTPAITMDATRMAQSGRNEKGEEVILITDLKTDRQEQFPIKAFNKDWKCGFGWLKFSPDGKALGMRFFPGASGGSAGVIIRNNGPEPGDEAVEYVGVIWFDGRKDRTSLFRLDQPREKGGHYAGIADFEWSEGPPPAKK